MIRLFIMALCMFQWIYGADHKNTGHILRSFQSQYIDANGEANIPHADVSQCIREFRQHTVKLLLRDIFSVEHEFSQYQQWWKKVNEWINTVNQSLRDRTLSAFQTVHNDLLHAVVHIRIILMTMKAPVKLPSGTLLPKLPLQEVPSRIQAIIRILGKPTVQRMFPLLTTPAALNDIRAHLITQVLIRLCFHFNAYYDATTLPSSETMLQAWLVKLTPNNRLHHRAATMLTWYHSRQQLKKYDRRCEETNADKATAERFVRATKHTEGLFRTGKMYEDATMETLSMYTIKVIQQRCRRVLELSDCYEQLVATIANDHPVVISEHSTTAVASGTGKKTKRDASDNLEIDPEDKKKTKE